MAVPNQALADQFAARMAAGDYSGAAALGRGAGYTDSQIAEYVGNMGTFKAADGATITQQTARDALGGLSTQNYGSGGLLNGQPNAEQQAFFAGRVGNADFRGAEQYANSLGFSQGQIADYVGAQGVRDNTGNVLTTQNANDYMNRTQNELNPRFATPVTPTTPTTPTTPGTPTTPVTPVAPVVTTPTSPTTPATGGGTTTPTFTPTPYTPPASPTMQPYQRNPYLDDMARGITSQMNDNWTRNIAPSLRSGAMAAGGFGGSRQGVVEANALNDMNRSLGQNLSNLYGNDYTQDRQRALQQYSADQGFALGQGNLTLGNRQADQSYSLGLGNLANSNRQTDNAFTLGQGNLALGNRTADQSYALGVGNLGLGYNNSNNSLMLGMGNLANQNRQTDNAFTLGQGNLALGQQQANNSYSLGLGNLALGNTQANNSYNLGQGQLGLNYAQLDNNIYQNNFNNSLSAANFGLNAYNTMNGQTGAGIAAGTTLNGVPQQNQQYFNNQYQTYGNTGGTANSTGTQGTTSNGAVSGAGIGSMVGQFMQPTSNLGIGVSGGVNPNNVNPYSIASGYGPGLR